jgi:hypothetical protein
MLESVGAMVKVKGCFAKRLEGQDRDFVDAGNPIH